MVPPSDCTKPRSRRQLLLQARFKLAYCGWTLFDNDGQVKGPLALLAAFPGSAVFHRYCAGAFLERFESPYFIARCSYKTFGIRRYERMTCLLHYCLVADLCRFGPLETCGGIGAQCHCKCISSSDIYLFADVLLFPEVIAGNLYRCSSYSRGARCQPQR